MTIDTPKIAIFAAVVFFYLKHVFLQWRFARAEANKVNIEIAKARKKGKTPVIPPKPEGFFSLKVLSWYAVVPALLITLLGFAMPTMTFLPAEITAYWWVVTVCGIIGFSFAVK